MPSIDRIPGMGYSEPAPSVGESSGFAGGLSAIGTAGLDLLPSRTTTTIDKRRQTDLSPQAIDQLIYEALSGQGGVSAIRSAEAGAGGYGSTTAAIQSAELISEIAAQIGQATGPKVEQSQTTTKKKKSVICTKLYDAGLLDGVLYSMGRVHFLELPENVVEGYSAWAVPIARLIPENRFLTRIALFIAVRRYTYIVFNQWSLTGWLTVALAEPICGVIGNARRQCVHS